MPTVYYFPLNQFYILIIGCIFFVASIVSFQIYQRNNLSILLLFFSGIFMCSFMALLDPFINTWDEQFHALVAKNCISKPFEPSLYLNHVLPFDYRNWTANQVWLHKQPLFMWQIALSLKLFGLNEFAIRIPSILMMSIVPFFIYRIGKIVLSIPVGFYAALLFSSSYFVHELCTGFPPSDHNDIAFLFYVTASFWSYIEFEESQKKYWLFFIGLFSGCAILVKWLTGLLVFLGWGLSILFSKTKRNEKKKYKEILLSLLVCLGVFLPWQLYTLSAFPLESKYEFSLNTKHFFTVIENHGGNYLYYFKNLNLLYGGGQLVPFLVLFSLFVLYKSIKNTSYKLSIFPSIIFVYLFFTLAATKMISFCFIVSPFIFLALATILNKLVEFVKVKIHVNSVYKNLIIILIMLLISWANLNLYRIAYKHTLLITTNDNDKREQKIKDTQFIKSLSNLLPQKELVIFNCKKEKNIPIMFYTQFIAYDRLMNFEEYLELKNKKISCAVIDNGKLPQFLAEDPLILKVKAPDNSWEEIN
jgi:4-amino-4-deoxy-L-arabinose transferase-like glycosyltransferase